MSTKIEWCEETWNPIIGCSHISPGCDNCYTERMAGRIANMGNENYQEVVNKNNGSSIYAGKWFGNTHLVESALYKPLRWKKPRTIFVCSMGDLFHESVPFEWINKVMAIAALTPHHTYLLLTKRPEIMKMYFGQEWIGLIKKWENACYEMGISEGEDDIDSPPCFINNRCWGVIKKDWAGMPLSNVWLGVTAEINARAHQRIPILLQIPAAKRFVSIEPMLSRVDLQSIQHSNEMFIDTLTGQMKVSTQHRVLNPTMKEKLDWVIVGGESGPNARPMHPDWVRSIRDQCQSAEVPFFFKQWGEYLHGSGLNALQVMQRKYDSKIIRLQPGGEGDYLFYAKVGKKKAGHLLDGKEWRERP